MGDAGATVATAAPAPVPRGATDGWRYLVPAALLVVMAGAWVHAVSPGEPAFPLDDPYIVAHNVTVLRDGFDPNYVGVPALVGATSPVHLGLVALLSTVLPVLYALEVSLWIGALLYALGLAYLARANGAGPGLALLIVVAGMLAGRTPHQLLNGLETGLAMAGITWALAAATEARRPWVLWLICGTLPFIRPELAVLSVGLAALPVLRTFRQEGSEASARVLAYAGIVMMAAALPWLLWSVANTGSPLPGTISAKRAWFADAELSAGVKTIWMATSTARFLQPFGIAAAGILPLAWSPAGRACLAFGAVFYAAYWANLPGALSHNEQRYLYVFAPMLVFGALQLWRLTAPHRRRWVTIAVAGLAAQTAILAPTYWQEYVALRTSYHQELDGVATWCRDHLPEDATILVHDAGYMAFATDFRLIDLVGLKTPAAIAVHEGLTLPSAGTGRGEALDHIAGMSGADYLVVLDLWNGMFGITEALTMRGWSLVDLRREGAYRVWHLTPPGLPATRGGDATWEVTAPGHQP